MGKITINESVYNIHPIYNLYAASENGEILHICKNVKMKGNINHSGYLKINATRKIALCISISHDHFTSITG